ncbi:acyltransferase [Photobacterium kishitanii]|uniref:acyltransferase family protein n=1 Tax=Photobacterium kishitanii TaxID=318456 RepID=UPI00311CB044
MLTYFKNFYPLNIKRFTVYLSIQYLRALAAIMVVIAHSSHKATIYNIDLLSSFKIGGSGVDLFFIISGFIMCLTVDRNRQSFTSFMKARVVRIAPLYWILTCVALTIYLINPDLVNSSSTRPTSIFSSFTLIPNGNPYLINNAWTLSYEFFFYLVFAFFLFSKNNQKLFTSITLIILVIIGLVFPPVDPKWVLKPTTFITNPVLIEFVMGIVAYKIITNKMLSTKTAIITTLIAIAIMITNNFYSSLWIHTLGHIIVYGIPMFLLFIGFVSLESKIPKINLLYQLGMSSYALYLVHPFIITGVTIVMRKLGIINIGPLYVMAMIIGSAIAGFLCYKLIEMPIDRFLKAKIKKQPATA